MAGLTDSKVFNGIISFLLIIMIVFLSVNIYYHNQVTDVVLWFTPSLMLTMNIILLLVTILFLFVSLYRTFRSKGERDSDLRGIQKKLPDSFKKLGNNRINIQGRNGDMITVERIKDGLYKDIKKPNEFYECHSGECDMDVPSDRYIRERNPKWDNTRRI